MEEKSLEKDKTTDNTLMEEKSLEKDKTTDNALIEEKSLEKDKTTDNTLIEEKSLKKEKKYLKIDYKSPVTLCQFISEGGKISPARITNLNHSQQRKLRNAIKKARRLSLIPSSVRAYDDFGWPEQISAVPFEID